MFSSKLRPRIGRLFRDVTIATGLCLVATGTSGQVAPTTFQFSFSNPGARSLGFGGAFVALADDATAAFANPAGLVQLSRPEVSLGARLWSYSTPFTEGGRISGRPTGMGLDSVAGLRTGISSETLAGVSFVSFVFPKDDWAFAVYRHQLANFESTSENQGFFGETVPGVGGVERFDDRRSTTKLEMVSFGFTAARRLGEKVSVGAGVSYVPADFDRQVDLFPPSESTLPDGMFGRNSYDARGREVSTFFRIDGSDVTFNAGFLWQIAKGRSFGGFYRRGPRLELEHEDVSGPALVEDFPEGTVLALDASPIAFPDVWGLGGAFRSGE